MRLNKTDKLILAKLREGRCTPTYLSEELSRDRAYISQRLKLLREAGIIRRVHQGLYSHSELQESGINAENYIEQTTDEDLIVCNDLHDDSGLSFSNPPEIEIKEIDVHNLASVTDRVSSEDTTQQIESLLRDIFWYIAKEGEVTQKELEQNISDLDERLPVGDFEEYWRYQLQNGKRLAKHPNIGYVSPSKLRYTCDSIVVRI